MIPSDWTPYRRESDGELVGYLVAEDADCDLVVPTSLIGLPLGVGQSVEDARKVLLARGLAALAERWWCRLPDPLSTDLDLIAEPDPAWGWRSVLIVEVNPVSSRIRVEMAEPEEMKVQVSLPNPVGELLRVRPPE